MGIIYKKNKAIYIGEFQNGKYEGLGRKCLENGDMGDGFWKNGFMYDIGVYYRESERSYILGCFYENNANSIYHQGDGFPYVLISI